MNFQLAQRDIFATRRLMSSCCCTIFYLKLGLEAVTFLFVFWLINYTFVQCTQCYISKSRIIVSFLNTLLKKGSPRKVRLFYFWPETSMKLITELCVSILKKVLLRDFRSNYCSSTIYFSKPKSQRDIHMINRHGTAIPP